DFASLSAVAGPTEQLPAVPQPEAEAEPEPSGAAAESDEQVKVIGSLRIGIPLYNVYLNEADEWSRRLATELAEWALALNRPMPGMSPFGVVEDGDLAAPTGDLPAEIEPPAPVELPVAAAPAEAMPAAKVPARAMAQFDTGDEEEGIDVVDAVDPDLLPIFED